MDSDNQEAIEREIALIDAQIGQYIDSASREELNALPLAQKHSELLKCRDIVARLMLRIRQGQNATLH